MKAITSCSSPAAKRLPALCLTFGLCFWANPMKAQTDYTWDNLTGDGIVTGGVGDWDTSNAKWTTDLGLTNVSWVNAGTPNNAIFGGATGTVTVTTPITLGNLTFNSGHSITGSTLTFGSATPTITANSALGTISSVIAGSSGLTFVATGGIAGTYLDGNNTYTGVTNVNSGFVIARNAGALGGSADGTVVASGATLQLENGGGGDVNIANEAVTISGTGVAGNRGALASWAGNNVWGGSVTLAANSTVLVNTGNLSIDGVVSGSGFNLTKIGVGQLTLGGTAANTFTGTTIVDNGTIVLGKTAGVPAIIGAVQMGGTTGNQPNLRMAANEQFGAGVVMTFVNPAGSYPRFDLQGTTQTLAGMQDVTGAGVTQNEKLGGGGTTADATLQLNGTGTYSYNGYLRNRDGGAAPWLLSLVKSGAGTQTLTGGNINYTGTTTVNAGVLALLNTPSFTSSTTVNSGGTLRLTNTNASSPYTPLSGTAAIVVNSGGVLELNNATTTYANRKTVPNAISGAGTINVIGTGYLALQTVNNITLSGQINVLSGGLGNDSGNSANAFGVNTAALDISAGAFFDLRGGAPQFGALTGLGSVINSFSANTITLGANDGSGAFSGAMQTGGNAITGTGGAGGSVLSLSKIGAGTQTLSGANITYTGTTTVNAGVLALVNTPVRAGASTINGGTLRLDTNAAVHTAGVTINTGGTLNLRTANTTVDANRFTGAITGTGTIVKDGVGWYHTQATSMANFAGTINVLQGRFGNAFNTSVWTNSTADAFVDAGAELDLRTDDMILDQLTGTGSVINTFYVGETNTLTVGIANGSSQFDGIIRGNQTGANNDSIDAGRNALRKVGTGTFTLTGVNTFTGGATVNDGVLRISGGNDRIFPTNVLTVNGGDPAGGVFDLNALNQTVSGLSGGSGVVKGLVTSTATGTAILTVSGTSTFDGNIQDGGAGKVVALTKSNNGTLTLTGVNTQTGPTLITGGALRQLSATALSPNSNIQLNGGIVELGMTDFSDPLGTGAAQIQFLGSGGFGAFGAPRNLNIGGMLDDLVWGTGNFVPNGSSLILSGPNSNDTVRLQNGLDLNGGARRIISLGGTAAIDAELVGDITNGSLTLAPADASFLVTGLVNVATVLENGANVPNNMQLVLQRPGGNAINGAFQIGTTAGVNYATVRLGADQQIADTTVVTFGAPAGKWSYLNLSGFNETIGGLSNLPSMDGGVVQLVEGDASPAVNSTLTLNVTAGTQSFLGHIRDRNTGVSNHPTAGKLNFVKTGAGTQELATYNNQAWTGTTSVQGGTLRLIMNNGANLVGAVTVDATGDPNATLDLAPAGANNYNISGAVSGNGTVVKSGTGTASLLNTTVSLTGNILVQQGTLRNDGNGTNWSASSANLDVSSGATFDMRADSVRLNALTGAGLVTNSFGNGVGVFDTLTIGVNGASSHFSGNITDGGGGSGDGRGSLGITKEGAGTQILSGNNNYSGITTIAGGTLQIGNGGTSGSLGTGPVVDNAALVFNRSDDIVAASAITGTGTLTKQGSGVLTLNASNTYLGSTTISAGTIRLGASQTMNVTSAIWLDAADGATINTGGGGALTSWVNKGSLGAAANGIPVAGQEPTFISSVPAMNNNAAIRFDADATGGTPFDRILLPQDYTAGNVSIIYAGRLTGGSNQRLVAANGNNWLLGTWNGNSESAYFTNGFLNNSVTPDTNARIYTGTIATGGVAEFYVNGVLKGVGGGAQGPNGISLGGGYINSGTEFSDADIGEFLVFDGVLTSTQRQQVQDYLARKWQGVGTLNVLPNTTTVILTNSGAKLDINGVTQNVARLEGVSGTEVLLGTGGGSLAIGTDNVDATFSGNLSGTGNFAKSGTGVQTMGGTNTSVGITSLTGGTLLLASNTALSPNSELILSTGTTLKTGGFNADTGAITLNAGTAVIDMSGGNSTLTFADINAWSGLLQVWNYDGSVWQNASNDKLIFTANNFALNLSSVEFYSGAGTGLIGTGAGFYSGTDGQLVPVPEPSAICAALALLGGIAYRERRVRHRRS